MKVCVIGTGYVGLVAGACFAELGHNVICIDKDRDKIAALKNNVIPIYEPGLEELIKKNRFENRITFSTSIEEGVKSSVVIFIAVGTPMKADTGEADLSFIEEVAREIAINMDDYKAVSYTHLTLPTN